MRGFGVLLLIVVLLLAGLHAFGSVNQYENEAGLTAEALMLPLMEEIVEAKGVGFVNRWPMRNLQSQLLIIMMRLPF